MFSRWDTKSSQLRRKGNGKVKLANEPRGSSSKSLAQFLKSKATGSIATSPIFCQDSLTVRWNPFIIMGGERHWVRVKCCSQEHNNEVRFQTQTLRPRVQHAKRLASKSPTKRGREICYLACLCHQKFYRVQKSISFHNS